MLSNDTGLSAADVAAVMNGNGNGGFGGWGDNSFWLIILFLFMFNNGWGNGFGNGYGGTPYVANDVQRGFDQSAIVGGVNGIQTSLVNGFADVNQALCNGFAGVSNGFAQAEIGANNRQMANMNQMFGIQSALQSCCCENRQSTADLKYTVATEACADRQAVNDGIRDLMSANTANTQALLNTINGGIQSIQDKLCQQELDALKAENANLQTQINLANLQNSQGAQTAQIISALTPKAPIPAYAVPNPNTGCCKQNTCCNGGF